MNACIVGYGCIGPVHAISIKHTECATVYAICDIVKERADKGAEEYGAKAYYDYDECLKDENIDVVHICTPHYLHFEMVKKALEAGKQVVCEKPVTMKKEEFKLLYENYDITKVFPIIQNRTNDCIVKMRELIAENDYGKLKGAKGFVTWHRDETYYNSEEWRGKKATEGGGALINQSVHTLDLMMLFCGKAKCVEATMKNYSLKGVIEVEDTVDAYIQYENGATGIFYATNAYAGHTDPLVEVVFENARLTYNERKLFVDGKLVCEDGSGYLGKIYWGKGHANTISDFYTGKSKLTLADIKNTMDAMFAIYDSVESGEVVNL